MCSGVGCTSGVIVASVVGPEGRADLSSTGYTSRGA